MEDFDEEPEPTSGRWWFAGWVGVGVALGAVLVAGGWWLVRPAQTPVAASGATSTVNCVWRPPTLPSGLALSSGESPFPELRDVGTPPATGNPRGGTATMRLNTNLGVITIAMDQKKAPCTVASFRYLAGRHFFDGSRCHRLTTKGIFVLQCGDPTATGAGGPTYLYDDENVPLQATGATTKTLYRRGTVALANEGPNTNGSQFFIAYQDSMIEASDSVLGVVTSGLDIVDRVAAGGIPPYYQDSTGDGEPNLGPVLNSVTVTP